ncbi:MAG: CBS domain-containing protein [Thaumarchaeota archaeon]|nr:CBS domain-containing protein [Nitrososphaerota archaeon]
MVLYARDIVEKDFLSLSSQTTVYKAAEAMKKTKHGFALIGSTDQPEGIVTEWDIVSKVVAEGLDPAKVAVGGIMSTEVVSVEGNIGIEAVSRMMNDRGIRRMLVKENGAVLGFITSKTILARLNEYVDRVSSQISRLQTPWL